jgi:hypothetical protein
MKTCPGEWCHIGSATAPPRPCEVTQWYYGWEMVTRAKPDEVLPHLGAKVPVTVYVTGRGLCTSTAFVCGVYVHGDPDDPAWPATARLVGSDPLTPA